MKALQSEIQVSNRPAAAGIQKAMGRVQSPLFHLSFPVLLGLLTLPFLAQAQSYSIDWYTIDGGGGTSTNGQFRVTGTIGQPDAGRVIGGAFTLQGGFWSIVAVVQTPGAPTLIATRTETNTVVVSWPGPEAGWKLHWTASLSTTPVSWTEIPPPYATSATNLYFVEPAPGGNRFYRLHKP